MPFHTLSGSNPDRSTINLAIKDEVRCWTKQLGVTRETLAEVVRKVGNSAAAVRKQLAA
jgi:hypothetical protein